MQIQTEFVVRAPIERVWTYLLDVHRVARCVPGAELTEVVDERTWKGKTNVKVGPVALSFAGTVVIQERDDAAHRVVLKAQGMEQRGNAQVITAYVPLANMFGYATDVRSNTQGRATYTMQFERYEEVPPNIAESIVGDKAAA